MKEIYFSNWWDIHNGRMSRAGTTQPLNPDNYIACGRAIYGDWGRLGNISVDENLNTFSQYNLKSPLVYKGHPSFCVKQSETSWDQEQNYNEYLFISKRIDHLFKYNYIKQNIEKTALAAKRRYKLKMIKFIEMIQSNNVSLATLHKNSTFISKLFYYLLHEHPELLSDVNAQIVSKLNSPMYSGGCIKSVNFQNNIYVVYCDGYRLSRLSIKRFDYINNIMENTPINEFVIDEMDCPIFEIDVAVFESFANILVRFNHHIVLLKLFEEGDLKIIKVSSLNSTEAFISCKLEPSWDKRAICTHPDQIRLVDSETLSNVWTKDLLCYSSVIDKWNEIQLAGIPNTWTITNRCSSYLYDCRINPFKSGVELYTNRAEAFSKCESFYHASTLFQDYYFYLFSTFNATLVDLRAPNLAVNEWTMPLMSPASYSSIDLLPDFSRVNVTVACQLNAKHIVFQQHDETHSKSSALSSRPGLFTNPPMALGLASHFNESSGVLSVLTLDHNANIFNQQYELNADDNNHHGSSLPPTYGIKSSRRFQEIERTIKLYDDFKQHRYVNRGGPTDAEYDMIERFLGMSDENEQKMSIN